MTIDIRTCKEKEFAAGISPIWQYFGVEPDEEMNASFRSISSAERLGRMKTLLAAILLTALLTAGCGGSRSQTQQSARTQTEGDRTIVATGEWRQRRIGRYYYQRGITAGKSYTIAARIFGPPSSRGSEYQSNVCIVRWRRLGLEIFFMGCYNRPCAPKSLERSGWWQTRVYSSSWMTDRSLKVGDSEERLRRLYPKARFEDKPPSAPRWILVRQPQDEFVWDLLVAEVQDGRVTAIVIPPDYIY